MQETDLFHRLSRAFEHNFSELGELGAACCVWDVERGPIIDLIGGERDRNGKPWETDTLVLVWSCTKGVAAATCLQAMVREKVALDRPVASVWPEFAANGKEAITISQLLSHQAGLAVLERAIDALDYEAVEAALAAQAPIETEGFTQAYHAKTYGYLLDAIVRRLTGANLGEYWRREIADPLGLEFWIGLPESLHHRVATIYAARSMEGTKGDAFYRRLAEASSITRRAFASPTGLPTPSSMNRPEARSAMLASLGGIGTARALAQFYALLATNRPPFEWPDAYWQAATTTTTQGLDGVLAHEVAFSAGFMKDPVVSGSKPRRLFGPSPRAFGQSGAGGSHAFGDPDRRIGFAYVMNQMEPGVLPGSKALSLVEALEELAPV